MYRSSYRNFGTYASLLVNHSVTAGTSTGIRWYELRDTGTGPSVYQQGTCAPDSNYRSRWGDYSSMSVDPVDDCTMWYTTEYLNTSGDIIWSTHIGHFKLGTCQ